MVRAIITAAGIGSRMGSEFNHAKCVLKADSESIIHRSVRILKELKVDVAVVVGYHSHEVINELTDLLVTIFYNEDYANSNNIVSLWCARDFINKNEDLLILNADLYYEKEMIFKLLNDTRGVVVLADKSKVIHGLGDFFLEVRDGIVYNYGKNLSNAKNMESFGISKVPAEKITKLIFHLTKTIQDGNFSKWWANILYESLKPVYTIDVSEYYWTEVDYMSDYEKLLKYVKTKNYLLKYEK